MMPFWGFYTREEDKIRASREENIVDFYVVPQMCDDIATGVARACHGCATIVSRLCDNINRCMICLFR